MSNIKGEKYLHGGGGNKQFWVFFFWKLKIKVLGVGVERLEAGEQLCSDAGGLCNFWEERAQEFV